MTARPIRAVACLRPKCGHRWYPRTPQRPAVCPRCKSPLWDRAPKIKPVNEAAQ